jgi:putative PIG3 family NAD(P)H quinone oxidoreductase
VRRHALDMRFDAGYFGLERLDTLLELVDAQGVEVLASELDQWIARLRWEKVVDIHRGPKLTHGGAKSITASAMANSLPSTMQAVIADGSGGLALVERPLPTPSEGEVLVKVAAAGINRPDILQRGGLYPPPRGAPDILGLEMAGEVVASGPGAEELIGQQVCALVAGGGYAEYCLAPTGTCLPVPEALTLVEAAAIPETLYTVWINLFERGFAADGDWVLVHGGTSGIGTMAIALSGLFGLNIIVTCGSDEKCARALELGAAAAINYRTQDFVEEVHRATSSRGVDVVLDMIGGDYLPRNLSCLADDGRHISIAVQRGASAELPIFEVMRRRLILTGSTLRPRSLEFKTMVTDEIAGSVWPYAASGRLKPVIDRVFPLEEAAAAHARMESGEHVGKIVLTP